MDDYATIPQETPRPSRRVLLWSWVLAGVVSAMFLACLLLFRSVLSPRQPVIPPETPDPVLLVQGVDATEQGSSDRSLSFSSSPSFADTLLRPSPTPTSKSSTQEDNGDWIIEHEVEAEDYEPLRTGRKDIERAENDDPKEIEPAAKPVSPARHKPQMTVRIQASTASGSGSARRGFSPDTHSGYYTTGLGLPPFNPSSYEQAVPMSLGVNAELELTRHWALSIGLDYSRRTGYRVVDNAYQSNTLHYLGVPLEAHYHFWPESRFRLFMGAGLKAEKNLQGKRAVSVRDPFLFSANLQVGAEVRIFPGVRVYFAPVLTQYLNRSAYLNDWDTKPFLSLCAGMTFDL